MLQRIALAYVLCSTTTSATVQAGDAYPAANGQIDAIGNSVQAAPTYPAALKVTRACEFGVSGDVAVAERPPSLSRRHHLGQRNGARAAPRRPCRPTCRAPNPLP
jgi:hypothetical protein